MRGVGVCRIYLGPVTQQPLWRRGVAYEEDDEGNMIQLDSVAHDASKLRGVVRMWSSMCQCECPECPDCLRKLKFAKSIYDLGEEEVFLNIEGVPEG